MLFIQSKKKIHFVILTKTEFSWEFFFSNAKKNNLLNPRIGLLPNGFFLWMHQPSPLNFLLSLTVMDQYNHHHHH